jgi:16S rRNA (cytosine967-C5)-methyltransferase
VLIDAPSTGTGTWRRNPDAKWRIRPGALAERLREQETVLEHAVALVKPGGRLAYITCSVLAEENGDQIRAFVGRHSDFSVEKPANVINVLGERAYLFGRAVLMSDHGLLMTPLRTDTDGFFVSLLRRSA